MAKSELKTQATSASVKDFINSVEDESKKADALAIDKLMQEITKEKPQMWGASIIGYGSELLKYKSGRELDWMKVGFSPRKQNLTLYVLRGGVEKYTDLLEKLGKHTIGTGCLYIKRISDVDPKVLRQLIERSVATEFLP